MFFIFVLAVTTWFAHMSEISITWTRVRSTDNYIGVSTFPRIEVSGKSVRDCACLCTSDLSCSSFHFLAATGKCLLYEFVFGKPSGGQASPGARYFRVSSADCPSSDGFVLLRRPHLCFKYFPNSTSTSFHYAYESCTSIGSRLIIVDTGDRLRALLAYMSSFISKTYIGGAREGAVNGSRTSWDNDLHPMYWLNGARVATSGQENYWTGGNPSNTNGEEGCMELDSRGWNDLPCSYDRPFICEKLPE